MKKSQILAALALAFALGVVIPVSGAVNAASAEWKVSEVDPTTGTASAADIDAAVAFVRGDASYANIAALKAVIDGKKIQYLVNDNGTTDHEDGKYYSLNGAIVNAISTALKTAILAIEPTNAAATKITVPVASEIKTDTLLDLIAAAKTVKNYEAYRKVVVAFEDKNTSALKTALEGINTALELTGGNKIDTALTNVQGYIDNNTLPAIPNYANYSTLVKEVNEYQARYDSYKAGYDLTFPIAKALAQNDQLTTAGLTGYDITVKENVPILRNIIALWDDTQGVYYVDPADDQVKAFGGAVAIANRAAWVDVIDKVDNAIAGKNFSASTMYDRIYKLARSYRQATYPEYSKYDIEEVAQIMVDYKAPANPNGPTDGNQGNQQGTDNGTDTAAPNTGALLNSDNGATTVSVVAGLATALTALGAGVVAYRNARRSSRK